VAQVLAQLHDADPVIHVRNPASGFAEYGKRAKDEAMIGWAIRVRTAACRQLGRVIFEMQQRGELIGPHGEGHGKSAYPWGKQN
jgi:hypothetical protein